MTLLTTRGLCRDFDGLRAVDDVDFTLETGEIHAIIGPNGAGKSTFVSLLSGRLRPTAGRVIFDGRDVTRLPAHARVRLGIAYTFQITNIYTSMSVAENIALAAQSRLSPGLFGRGGVGPRITEATQAAARAVGLTERLNARAGDLAYGHQRLLEIAMGLALSPRLLILDEPTQGLSDAEIAGVTEVVRQLASRATILLIEHNMDVVMALARRITVLDRGAILAQGTPEEIVADPAVQAAYLGDGA
ncbi:ABC transporter ATP-binding protein [Mesobaculum littorinae]|uniref:ABC transporter ATP-binding protein n=1 Tax=Mesobaculum littorinae TaxID=2486419 RepID=UPI0019D4EE2F|nr:ABC transporter ATP-binding protein [Mesobaculum littorinae]